MSQHEKQMLIVLELLKQARAERKKAQQIAGWAKDDCQKFVHYYVSKAKNEVVQQLAKNLDHFQLPALGAWDYDDFRKKGGFYKTYFTSFADPIKTIHLQKTGKKFLVLEKHGRDYILAEFYDYGQASGWV